MIPNDYFAPVFGFAYILVGFTLAVALVAQARTDRRYRVESAANLRLAVLRSGFSDTAGDGGRTVTDDDSNADCPTVLQCSSRNAYRTGRDRTDASADSHGHSDGGTE